VVRYVVEPPSAAAVDAGVVADSAGFATVECAGTDALADELPRFAAIKPPKLRPYRHSSPQSRRMRRPQCGHFVRRSRLSTVRPHSHSNS